MAGQDLSSLYPELGEAQDGQKEDQALLLASLHRKSAESRMANEAFFAGCGDQLLRAADALARAFAGGGRMFTMGNGGSSCDAAHLAVEFLHPVTTGRRALSAINLTADVAVLSAVGNDVGIDQIFARQIEAQARNGDALVGFSTSGNSANLIAGFARARDLGLTTIGFAGGDGGAMASCKMVDHLLTVPTASIHRVQECHVVAYHILWDLVHSLLARRSGGRSL